MLGLLAFGANTAAISELSTIVPHTPDLTYPDLFWHVLLLHFMLQPGRIIPAAVPLPMG